MKKRFFGLILILCLIAGLLGSGKAIAEEYSVYVGNIQVTDANKDDVLNDGGKVKYDLNSKTLTLNNPAISALKSISNPQRTVYIYASGDLTIKGSATLENTDTSFTGICVLGNLTLTDASITVNSKKEGIYCQGKLTINSGTINSSTSGTGSYAIYAGGGMDISGGKATADGSQTGIGIYTNGQNLIIGGGTVETKGFIGISSGHTEINDGTVSSTGSSIGIMANDITINGGTVTAKGTGSSGIGISAGLSDSTIRFGNNLTSVTAEGTESAITSYGTNTPITLGDKVVIKEPAGGKIVTTGGKTIIQSGDATATRVVIKPGTAYTVTYKLDGWITWSDGSTENKTETVISGDKPAKVPTGMKASWLPDGYNATGNWYNQDKQLTKPANQTITSDTTFVYKVSYTITEEQKKKESTVYAGEIFVDGVSQMRYLYSTDLTNNQQVFLNLKDALAGTAFSGLVPKFTGGSENKGLAVSSVHQSEMNENWKNSSNAAAQFFTGTIGTETNSNLYDTDTSYKKCIDDTYQERKETYDNPLQFEKSIGTALNTTTDFVWVNKDSVLVKCYTITASVELTEVRYTFVNVITTPTHTHSYAAEWSKDEKNHWHACTFTVGTCDAPRKDEAAHVYGDAGDARFTCTVCAYVDAAKKNEAEVADNAAAGAVDAMIKALPAASDVTENDRAAIEAARAAYNALTDAQKAKISAETLQWLTAAEAALAALAEQPQKTDLSGAVVTTADQVYTGSAVTPALTVTYGEKALTVGVDYTAAYSNNVNIGLATVTITGTGDYTGTASGTFTILPKKVGSPKLKAGKNQLTVKWKADKSVTGYEIEYSLKKNFKKAKKITVKKAKTTSYVIKKLKSKKTYYVRVRSFKTVAGKKYYSEWSKTLSKKVK